jgi:hypothetical protein
MEKIPLTPDASREALLDRLPPNVREIVAKNWKPETPKKLVDDASSEKPTSTAPRRNDPAWKPNLEHRLNEKDRE